MDQQFAILPLSSSLATRLAPSLRAALAPVLSRLALLEHLLLVSPPAHLALKLRLGPRRFLSLCTLLFAAAAVRFRHQWRVALALAGVGEAVARGVACLWDLEVGTLDGDSEMQRLRRARLARELKHLLSFWVLFATVNLVESIALPALLVLPAPRKFNATPPGRLLSLRTLNKVKTRLLQLLNSLPPALQLSIFAPIPRAQLRAIRPFPAPLPLSPISPLSRALELAARNSRQRFFPDQIFRSEASWRVFKMLLLWAGLRRDGWGASMLWDWGFGPIFLVMRKREEARLRRDKESGAGDGKRRRRVVKVIVVDDDTTSDEGEQTDRTNHDRQRKVLNGLSGGLGGAQMSRESSYSNRPGQDALSDHEAGGNGTTILNPSEPITPSSLSHTYASDAPFNAQDGEDDFDRSFDSQLTTSSHTIESPRVGNAHPVLGNLGHGEQKFPTPNIPYRLTSSSFPIHARVPSMTFVPQAGSAAQQRIESPPPSPSPAHTTSLGGYSLEPIHLTSSSLSALSGGKKPLRDIKRYLSGVHARGLDDHDGLEGHAGSGQWADL